MKKRFMVIIMKLGEADKNGNIYTKESANEMIRNNPEFTKPIMINGILYVVDKVEVRGDDVVAFVVER